MCSGPSCTPLLSRAFGRYKKLIFFSGDADLKADPKTSVTTVFVSAQIAPPLQYGVDESYSLNIAASGNVTIQAQTEWGALRGIETFSQLVVYNPSTKAYTISGAPLAVTDAPRFSWRGLLIDTSRHFLPVRTIMRQIDALSFNKMNVLHWHLSDEETFPFLSDNFPDFAKTAWFPGLVYTPKDIKQIVDYATDRGVRVVVEIDTPGHASCWQTVYPQLFVNCPGNYPLFILPAPTSITFSVLSSENCFRSFLMLIFISVETKFSISAGTALPTLNNLCKRIISKVSPSCKLTTKNNWKS